MSIYDGAIGLEVVVRSPAGKSVFRLFSRPSMAGLKQRSAELVESSEYTGDATSAREYIREAIVEPDAHIVPGQNHASNGTSLMPSDYSERLSKEEISALVDFIMTLE